MEGIPKLEFFNSRYAVLFLVPKLSNKSGLRYSSGQKFSNDHSIWHSFFVSQPIDLNFWSKLHKTIVYVLAKNWKVWYFLAEVIFLRVSLSKSKVSKRSGILASLKVKTCIDRGSGSLYRKIILTKNFDRKAFNRRPFDRKFILPKKVIWPKTKFIKRTFDRKYLENGHLTENVTWKTSQMTEMTYDRKFIWPKAFFEKW
jgi:hypothetical protein